MSTTEIFNKGISDLVENVNRWAKFDPSTNYQRTITYPPQVQNVNNTVEDPNIMVSFVRTNGEYNYASMWQAHIELLEGARLCYGLYDAKVYVGNVDTGETVKNLVLLGYSRNGITQNYFIDNANTVYGATSQQSGRMVETDNDGRNVYSVSGSTQSWRGVNFETFSINVNAWRNLADYYKQYIIDHLTPTDDTLKNSVNTIQSSINDLVIGGSSSYQWFNGAWFNMGKSGRHAQSFTYNMLPFPVFDITDTDHIIAYLQNGNRTGEIDIFDPSPKTKFIDDLNSNYRMFVTKDNNNPKATHFSVVCYNEEMVEKWEGLSRYIGYNFRWTNDFSNYHEILDKEANTKYPTYNFSVEVPRDITHDFNIVITPHDYDDRSGQIVAGKFKYNSDSVVNVSNTGAYFFSPAMESTKTNVTDGYRYTATNGHWIEILYRAVSMDDLKDGYPDPEDKEDDKTGSDSSYSGATGLRTFAIDNASFETINKKLWSTDWTQVFKSSSIDPVKCVISCKGIPFTADNVATSEIVIANMNTGVSKNYVKCVKSYNIPSVLMPHYNDDFTDITLTHVRCYLPYVGWVEFPASEVISRVAYGVVGVEARPKRLGFKYLVDFVDGSCRVIVSVNGTERWFFDGHCGVDIPVTSDNHTQAISNAIRSGVQTGLSVITSVVGVATENVGAVAGGVMGAMNNAPNIYPTYSYTATSNGSGYINSSMNQHIMIVIERPNVIRDNDYNKRVGVPCGLSLSLGSLRGFTVCQEVDVNGIDATPDELAMIKSTLESGIYL